MFPNRIYKIDDLIRSEHHHLQSDDVCGYLCDYAAGKGYGHSQINQDIYNFKKPMREKDSASWKYKEIAIRKIGEALENAVCEIVRTKWIFVPIPPSNARNSPDYDDRLVQMLKIVRPELDVREMIVQDSDTEPAHRDGSRDPRVIAKQLRFDQEQYSDNIHNIIIVDDVLTTGAHFKAAQNVIKAEIPQANICGLFIARAIHIDDT